MGGLTLQLNDCTEAELVQGLHSEEFHDARTIVTSFFTMPAVPSQCRRWCPSLKRKTYRLAPSLSRSVSLLSLSLSLSLTLSLSHTLFVSLKTYPCLFPHWPLKKWWGLSPPPPPPPHTPQSGGGAKAPSAPPGSATPGSIVYYNLC